MASTRITVVLDVEHEPEVDVPVRAAAFLKRTLTDVEGIGAISVVRGETEEVVWMPHGARQAS